MDRLNQLKNQKGITLVELLIVLVLFVMVMGIGYTVIYYSRITFNTGTTRADTQQAARLVNNYLTEELRNVVEITTDQDTIDEDGHLNLENKALIIAGDVLSINKQIYGIHLEISGEGEADRAI